MSEAIIIPYNSPDIDLPASHTDFHCKNFRAKRSAVLNELRCISAIPEIVSNFNKDTVYKLVSTPEGGILHKNIEGNIKGVFYNKDGKIIEHAKFQTVRPSLVKAVSTIGSQVLLISIAMQLNSIEKGITRILDELHDDRISEILSGVNLFEQAMGMDDSKHQSVFIGNAVQTLNTGIEKTVRALKKQIEDMPNANLSFSDNWIENKSVEAKRKLIRAEESFQACLLGIKTLSECYATINEIDTAVETMRTNLFKLKSSGIEMAAQKARLVPPDGNKFPEESWNSFLENQSSLINEIDKYKSLKDDNFVSFELEFKPIELMEE